MCHSAQPLLYGATWWILRLSCRCFTQQVCLILKLFFTSRLPDRRVRMIAEEMLEVSASNSTLEAHLFDWLHPSLISQVITRRSTPCQVLQEITGEGELDVKLLTNLLGQMDIDNRLTAYF